MLENLFLILFLTSFFWIILLGVIFFSRIKLPEKLLSDSVKLISVFLTFVSFLLFVLAFYHSPLTVLLDYNDWIAVADYRFKVRFVVDLLGTTYALLSCALIGIIFKFSRNYLHREAGYFRFIFLLSIMLFGLMIVSFARSLDLMFAGWELVGTTSILLIGYFYDKPQPVMHALKAIISYRLCDMGILAASAWAHHHLHSTDFVMISSTLGHAHNHFALITIGCFVIWASLAKAGQLPMSSWLPTAMEGPTPSSAIFYGALSVHLGPFLLLRFYDYLKNFPSLLVLIGLIGVISSLYASMVGRTRSDAKTMLAYATISQVGIIYLEIALGFTNFAIFHMVTHASFRTYQFLRSSSLIQDFHDNPVVQVNHPIKRSLSMERLFKVETRRKIFVHALHGFHLDYFTGKIIRLFLLPMKTFMKLEKKKMELLNRIFLSALGKNK